MKILMNILFVFLVILILLFSIFLLIKIFEKTIEAIASAKFELERHDLDFWANGYKENNERLEKQIDSLENDIDEFMKVIKWLSRELYRNELGKSKFDSLNDVEQKYKIDQFVDEVFKKLKEGKLK